MPVNRTDRVVFARPGSDHDRRTIASACCDSLNLTMPCVVDSLDDRVDNLYAAWPERLYAIDATGRIAYASARGPWGFKPDQLASWLKSNVPAK